MEPVHIMKLKNQMPAVSLNNLDKCMKCLMHVALFAVLQMATLITVLVICWVFSDHQLWLALAVVFAGWLASSMYLAKQYLKHR